MNDVSLGSDPSTKLDFINYLCHVLSSDVDVCFAPSLRHEPPPIVTLDEIRNAKDLCPSSMGGSKILEINVSTILKVGPMVRMGEAETLYLLKERTSVPVPRVLNAYVIGDIGFILMEKIPGKSLEDCWEDMAEVSQRSIVRQLDGFIQEWRQIEGPVFGSVDGGPCEDILFKHSWDATPRQYGPFPTRKAFNQGVVEALRYSRPQAKLTAKDEPLAQKILASGDQDERKVLTHGDLHQSNIIVDDDVVTGVIDWGAAGYSIWAREYFGIRWQALDLEWRRLTSTLVGVDEYEFWAEVNQSMLDYTGI
ncbi:protein kinase-like protein [Aspergillus taichungensis]|uniref:Protein kinase-like protein n=1 Tax=Aspergillus taichungensis TaxID=482145 RepID=A0A2J5HQA2_9EURO|nr:protein kinase-like protein [Aspergillus taichungensis]